MCQPFLRSKSAISVVGRRASLGAFYESYIDCLGSQHLPLGIDNTKSTEGLLDNAHVRLDPAYSEGPVVS